MEFKYNTLFPHRSIRNGQETSIQFALDEFINKKKRYVIIEAGTGVGKSAVGLTVAKYMNNHMSETEEFCQGSYFVTTQKILQDQYEKDFGGTKGKMRSIKSSSNYKCGYHKKNTCQESQQLLRTEDKGTRFFKACTFNCRYKNFKKAFIESPESVTNFPYLLIESAFSGKIVPRNFMVIDEAHNIESELSKFIEVKISERFIKQALKMRWPDVTTQFQVHRWISDTYYPKIRSQLSHLEGMLEKTGLKSRIKEFSKIAKHYDIIKGHVSKIKTFLSVYDKDNWVMQIIPAYGRSQRKFSFRAIDISPFSKDYLFKLGKKILMMSATILDRDTFCESLGLDIDEVSFISIPSPFPSENSPIFAHPVGDMGASNINESLPRMKAAVEEILSHHVGEKGIIHCHTYRIANYLKDNIRDSRLLSHNSDNRDTVLDRHKRSKKPTVLLSPSMAEGVDLKENLSRFQIIVKIPYPYLGDPLIRKRMNNNKGWYQLQTAKLIVQASGRSIRSDSDKAVTYILDAGWSNFYGRSSLIFPKSFKNRMKNK